MFKAIHQEIKRKWKIASLDNIYGKMSVGFCLNTGKGSYRFNFIAIRKIPLKTVLGNFKTDLRLRDRHVFAWHSLEILNVFITLTLK